MVLGFISLCLVGDIFTGDRPSITIKILIQDADTTGTMWFLHTSTSSRLMKRNDRTLTSLKLSFTNNKAEMGHCPNEKKWGGITTKFISLSTFVRKINERYQEEEEEAGKEEEEEAQPIGKSTFHFLNSLDWFWWQFWIQRNPLTRSISWWIQLKWSS